MSLHAVESHDHKASRQNHIWTSHHDLVKPARLGSASLDHPGLKHPYPFGTFSVLRVRTEEIDDG
jgi:hypothetical protein